MKRSYNGDVIRGRREPELHTLKSLDESKGDPLGHIAILGKKKSGKSVISGYIVRRRWRKYGIGKLKKVGVMSSTEQFNHNYENHFGVDPAYIRNGFDEEFLEMITNHQKEIAKIKGADRPKYGFLLILDDLAFEASVYQHPLIKEIMFNGRNFNMALVIIAQEPIAIPKEYRNNLDLVIATREAMPKQLKNLYDNYFSMFLNLPTFLKNFKHYTANHTALVFNNSAHAETVEESNFTWKVPYIRDCEIVEPSDPTHPEYEQWKQKELEKKSKAEHIETDDTSEKGKSAEEISQMRSKRLKTQLQEELNTYAENDSETENNQNENITAISSDSDDSSNEISETSEDSSDGDVTSGNISEQEEDSDIDDTIKNLNADPFCNNSNNKRKREEDGSNINDEIQIQSEINNLNDQYSNVYERQRKKRIVENMISKGAQPLEFLPELNNSSSDSCLTSSKLTPKPSHPSLITQQNNHNLYPAENIQQNSDENDNENAKIIEDLTNSTSTDEEESDESDESDDDDSNNQSSSEDEDDDDDE